MNTLKRISLIMMMIFISAVVFAFNTKVQKNVKSGSYHSEVVISRNVLKDLPIPATNEDYTILQSIDDITTIVLGIFTSGHRRIVWIQDSNNDGQVDRSSTWYVDKKRFFNLRRPSRIYTNEKFKKMKEDIISGRQGDVFPNIEAESYMLELSKKPENVRRWKKGYEVYMVDYDDPSRIRVSYSFSDNDNRGVDMVMVVNYRNMGRMRVSPVISKGVYCRNSTDTFIIKKTKELIKKIKELDYGK
jgi:hypothetical protein